MHYKNAFHMGRWVLVVSICLFLMTPRTQAQTGKKINGDSLQLAGDIREMETIIRDLAARISLFEEDNKSKTRMMMLIGEKRKIIDSQLAMLRADSLTMEKMNKNNKNAQQRLEKTKNGLAENKTRLKQLDKDFALLQSNKIESDAAIAHSRQLLLELSAKLVEYKKLASQ